MKEEHDFGMEASALVRAASANRDWADAFDRDAISVNLGELREYFAETMLRARRPEQKQALRHHLQRAYTRMTVCDIAWTRLAQEESFLRVKLEHMAKALREGTPDMFPVAKKAACMVRDRGWNFFQEGRLGGYALIALTLSDERGIAGEEDMGRLKLLSELAADLPARGLDDDDAFVVEYRAYGWKMQNRMETISQADR